jgi:acetyl-CoA synthetase
MAEREIVWRPDPEEARASRLGRFLEKHGLASVQELRERAARDLDSVAWFWDEVMRDLGLEWDEPYASVLDASRGIPWTTWWVGGKLNYVRNAVDRHARGARADADAIVYESEEGDVRRLTYRELHEETCRVAGALRSLEVGKGDRVGIFLPMNPECVVATLAVSKIGAIFIPIFSGYGADAVAQRLQDSEAKLLVTADGFPRRGKAVAMKETADEAAALSPTVEHVLVLRRLVREVSWTEGRDVWWHDVVPEQPSECPTESTSAEDPYMLIYTSGTTGRPKGTVHVHGGFPLKGLMDMAYCFDVRESDVFYWISDMGWMMGPWVVSGTLTLGATLFLYDGALDHPEPDRLWDVLERHGVTVLGISPTAVRAMMREDESWLRKHDLSSLRAIGSTGEPWNTAPWMWAFERIGGGRCPILNYSGGTEISGGITCCNPLEPLKPCSFTGPIPGMDAEVYDERGEPVRGAVGELVLRQPWPGMTRGFWRDPERYLDTYWSRWPDTWVHGDFIEVDGDGFWFIQGRSDDTIKVAGKRVGPAEVETALVAHPAVTEAAAVGVPHDLKGETVACFCVLAPGTEGSDGLREELSSVVTVALGKALRPSAVEFVGDLPKTRNAKIMRRVLRAHYLGENPGDLSALENPQALAALPRRAG